MFSFLSILGGFVQISAVVYMLVAIIVFGAVNLVLALLYGGKL